MRTIMPLRTKEVWVSDSDSDSDDGSDEMSSSFITTDVDNTLTQSLKDSLVLEPTVNKPTKKNTKVTQDDIPVVQVKRGDIGPRGEIGPIGKRGHRGDEGPKGDTGEKGDNGECGAQGEKGDNVVGEKGEQGVKGDKGDTGNEGAPGVQGSRGEKGERVVLWNGNVEVSFGDEPKLVALIPYNGRKYKLKNVEFVVKGVGSLVFELRNSDSVVGTIDKTLTEESTVFFSLDTFTNLKDEINLIQLFVVGSSEGSKHNVVAVEFTM